MEFEFRGERNATPIKPKEEKHLSTSFIEKPNQG
jgi:hypothetical protein